MCDEFGNLNSAMNDLTMGSMVEMAYVACFR